MNSFCMRILVFVHRMTLMLGAGMTVRRSWNRLLDDNERLDSGHLKEDWLYREMKYTRIQMESGVPEIQAYLEFGQRMELQQYKEVFSAADPIY